MNPQTNKYRLNLIAYCSFKLYINYSLDRTLLEKIWNFYTFFDNFGKEQMRADYLIIEIKFF
jgi:hypothetical protein